MESDLSVGSNVNRRIGARSLWVKGGCRRQAVATAGLPSAPEMPCAPTQLRLVPRADLHGAYPTAPQSARIQTKSETWRSLRVIEQTRRALSVHDLLPLAYGHCAEGFGMMV